MLQEKKKGFNTRRRRDFFKERKGSTG